MCARRKTDCLRKMSNKICRNICRYHAHIWFGIQVCDGAQAPVSCDKDIEKLLLTAKLTESINLIDEIDVFN